MCKNNPQSDHTLTCTCYSRSNQLNIYQPVISSFTSFHTIMLIFFYKLFIYFNNKSYAIGKESVVVWLSANEVRLTGAYVLRIKVSVSCKTNVCLLPGEQTPLYNIHLLTSCVTFYLFKIFEQKPVDIVWG